MGRLCNLDQMVGISRKANKVRSRVVLRVRIVDFVAVPLRIPLLTFHLNIGTLGLGVDSSNCLALIM